MLNLKSATKLFSVLLASTRPLITELADKLRLKYPLLPTISPVSYTHLDVYKRQVVTYALSSEVTGLPKITLAASPSEASKNMPVVPQDVYKRQPQVSIQ